MTGGYATRMTDSAYDEREDEREAHEAARGKTEREEEGKLHLPDDQQPARQEREEPES